MFCSNLGMFWLLSTDRYIKAISELLTRQIVFILLLKTTQYPIHLMKKYLSLYHMVVL